MKKGIDNLVDFFTNFRKIKYHIFPLVIIGFIYGVLEIATQQWAEKKIIDIDELTREIEEVKTEYLSLKSSYMIKSKQSEVEKMARKLGLQDSKGEAIIIRKRLE